MGSKKNDDGLMECRNECGKPKFEFSHSADGAGNSFVSRLKVKGRRSCRMDGVMCRKAAIRHSGSLRLR